MQAVLRTATLAAIVLAMNAWPAAGQGDVTIADIQRLEDEVRQVEREIGNLRPRDAGLAGQIEGDLDTLREDVTYLRVKMRRQERVTRAEYEDVRRQLETLRVRASGVTATPAPGEAGRIPVGTEIDLRLQSPLSSETAAVEDRFEATTVVDLRVHDEVMIPAGSIVRGMVTSVNRAGRVDRRGSLTLVFDEVRIGSRTYPLRGTVTEALESEGIRGEAGRIGTGAGVGAVIGGILGGVRGAVTGILIGAGGVVAATEGEDVELPPGTILRVRLDSPPEIDAPATRR